MEAFRKNSCWVFDLDDTLYKEINFVKSAYRHIAEQLTDRLGKNIYDELWAIRIAKLSVFDTLAERYDTGMTIDQLVHLYRYHIPIIDLEKDTITLLSTIKNFKKHTALVTDGRSISQRNKLKALGLEDFFDVVVISEELGTEKPNPQNFKQVIKCIKADNYIYIGDNYTKDFVTPNSLGWTTIGLLDNGLNIHRQDTKMAIEYLPKHVVTNLSIEEVKNLI